MTQLLVVAVVGMQIKSQPSGNVRYVPEGLMDECHISLQSLVTLLLQRTSALQIGSSSSEDTHFDLIHPNLRGLEWSWVECHGLEVIPALQNKDDAVQCAEIVEGQARVGQCFDTESAKTAPPITPPSVVSSIVQRSV